MVRRRTRATKTASGNIAPISSSTVAINLTKGDVLDEQYFASPKRKDCRLEENNKCAAAEINELCENKNIQDNKTKFSPGKNKSERGGILGRTIGVPLATRSQTRTIEHFFKTKTGAEKSAKIRGKKIEMENCIATTPTAISHNNNNNSNNNNNKFGVYPIVMHKFQTANADDGSSKMSPTQQSEHYFDLCDDITTDSELSCEYTAPNCVSGGVSAAAAPNSNISNFMTHRSYARSAGSGGSGGGDSNSSRSSTTTDNIFLQEPVLTLDVDKSPNQPSSIKINKTLEVEPIFSSPPTINSVAVATAAAAAAVLNGRFSQIVSLQCSPVKQRSSSSFDTHPSLTLHSATDNNNSQQCRLFSLEQDNSSCDSGVTLGTNTSSTPNTVSPQPALTALATRRQKPATPHRIVCRSPIKTAPRLLSPVCMAVGGAKAIIAVSTNAGGRKHVASKDQLSPRKAQQRHAATTTGSKTRRRLNQPKEQQQAPYNSTATTTIMRNDSKQDKMYHIKDEDEDQELENVQIACFGNLSQPITKSILNSNTQPQQQQHQQHQQQQQQEQQKSFEKKQHNTKTKAASNKLKTVPQQQQQQPKMKTISHISHTQPLAATNGNHTLAEYFPVRRSVRKTKTAVKEEMMRNLEQAIIEERADGLKVAHFENKGRGVVAERHFRRGEFVVEYVGDLISMAQAAEREKQYALDENAGCYMYYFKHKNQQYCIDATIDTGKLGRLVNHSRNGNLITKVVVVKQRPHLILVAKDDIEPGEELTYDYGDRSKESLLHHPWLAF